jgi:3-oxoacyl-[acyl-carrier protein] reductase
MMHGFDGKSVVVSGGAQGIGLGIARRFVDEGARVAIIDADQTALDTTLAEFASRGQDVSGHLADISDRSQVHAAISAAIASRGGIDVLVASAGIAGITPFLDITDSAWQRMFDVNVTGTFHTVQEAARVMSDGGSIVVVASTNAFFPEAETVHYSATKGALVAFVRAAALDLAPLGIRINAINPGLIRSRLSAVLVDDPVAGPAYLADIPLGRWGEASDIAGLAAYLASDDAAYVTGEAVTIDGGVTLGVALNVDRSRLTS